VIRRTLAKLARMDAGELSWRGATAARTLVDRGRHRMIASRWARKDLLPRLVPSRELSTAGEHLSAQRWDAAHVALVRHFGRGPRRLPVGPHSKHALTARIHREFPGAARHAALRADRILAGKYDLLGYRGLRFGRLTPGCTTLPDWSLDPVNNRRPPHAFWSSVPYLDAACGDHKIIWELNRHQHWLVLGRAFWLTGERRYRERFLAELGSWLRSNPPLTGVNWSSMLEVALRSLSWLWAIQLFVEAPDDSEDDRLRADASPWLVDLLLGLDRQLPAAFFVDGLDLGLDLRRDRAAFGRTFRCNHFCAQKRCRMPIGKGQVAIRRHEQSFAERVPDLADGHTILDHVAVSDEHHRRLLFRFLEHGLGRGCILFLLVRLSFRRLRFSRRKCGLELPA
jgi:hypothetical protein